MAVAFDTLAFHDRLRAGGFSEQQPKAATEAFAQATSQELATKGDLDRLEGVLRAEIDNVRTELRGELQAFEQRLLTRLTESQNAFIKWLVPLMIGQTALLAALVKLL